MREEDLGVEISRLAECLLTSIAYKDLLPKSNKEELYKISLRNAASLLAEAFALGYSQSFIDVLESPAFEQSIKDWH